MLTRDQLNAIMPSLPAAKGDVLFPTLSAAMAEFAIEAPPRAAAFLAQLAHESAQFRFMEEIWGPTAAQKRYEPASSLATTLGNTEAGDGKRFKGRGPIQITGRSNYRRFGQLLSCDLEADPARAALPELAFRIAGLFWSKKGLNELADEATDDSFREITRRINGGFNGLAERQRFYRVAKNVLGVRPSLVTRARGPVTRSPEPEFGRGYEAVQSDASRRRKRTPAKPKRAPRRTTRAKPTKKPRQRRAQKRSRRRS